MMINPVCLPLAVFPHFIRKLQVKAVESIVKSSSNSTKRITYHQGLVIKFNGDTQSSNKETQMFQNYKESSYMYFSEFFFFFFFKVFGGHMSFLGGHWYPCFGFLVTSPMGFKARVGSALFAIFLRRRM